MRNLTMGATLGGLLLGFAATDAAAATQIVNSLSDNGPGNCSTTCTLRDAIAASTAGDDILVDVSGTITLTSVITIGHDLRIVGRGAAGTVVSGNDATRIFNVTAGTVQIESLSLANGRSPGASAAGTAGGNANGEGGAIKVASGAQVTVRNVKLFDNKAIGGNGATAGAGNSGGGGGMGGNGGEFNVTPSAGQFGGGGGGGVHHMGAGGNAANGGFGGGGGGAGTGGAAGSGGTGAGNGGGMTSNGYGGGGGGAGFGGAIYAEGAVHLIGASFTGNEARGGNGGNGSLGGGGGGGGGGFGSAVFTRTGANLCTFADVTFTSGVVAGGAGGNGAGTGAGLETSTGRYEQGTNTCTTVSSVTIPDVSVSARQGAQWVSLSAKVTEATEVSTGTVMFTIKTASGTTVGSGTASVSDGVATTSVSLALVQGAHYYVWASYTDATMTHPDGSAVGTLRVTPQPVVLRTTVLAPNSAECATGGVQILSGLDDGLPTGFELDGVLQDGEVESTYNICHGATGATGATGANGYASLITAGTVAPGAECADGGFTIYSGLDDGAGAGEPHDGLLHADETDNTSLICHGEDGSNGTDGANGADGADGVEGQQGEAGKNGENGAPGADGAAGGCNSGGGAMNAAPLAAALFALAWRKRRAGDRVR